MNVSYFIVCLVKVWARLMDISFNAQFILISLEITMSSSLFPYFS